MSSRRRLAPRLAILHLHDGYRFVPPILRLHVISDFQKLSLTPDPNQLLIPRHPVPREGALAIVTDVGAGSGGRRLRF